MFSILLLLTLLALGCGGEKNEQPAPPVDAAKPGEAPGIISCQVKFEGRPPKMPVVKMQADKKCMVLHTEQVHFESIIMNTEGKLKNVFIYVKEGLAGKSFPPPTRPVELDQQGCMYTPHVLGIQVGQSLRILNNDPVLHNIHSLAKLNKSFNFAQPKKGMKTETSFTHPEVMVRIKCDVHSWMSSYVGVVSHPFYGVSNEAGSCELAGLPPGEYVVAAWHEELGTLEQKIKVSSGARAELSFTFRAQ